MYIVGEQASFLLEFLRHLSFTSERAVPAAEGSVGSQVVRAIELIPWTTAFHPFTSPMNATDCRLPGGLGPW